MSEAVAELQEAPPAPQKDADELLSQLAGKEVDRLLASADIEREDGLSPVVRVDGARAISSPAGPLAADAAKSPDDEAVLAQQIESLIARDRDKTAQTTTEPAAAHSVVDTVNGPAGDEPASVAVSNAAVIQSPAPIEPATPIEVKSTEDRPTAAGQASTASDAAPKPGDEAPGSESQAESISVDSIEIPGDGDRRLPFFVLPLDWLNRPFGFVSNATRDVMGKIAVVTSLNAAALFAYVIWFRHR